MGKSIKRQLEDISYSSIIPATRRAAAIHALGHPEWTNLMRGRQAYYRDFTLDALAYFVAQEIDASACPPIIKSLSDDGYLWELFSSLHNNWKLGSNIVYVAVRSLETAGLEVTPENAKKLIDFYVRCHTERPAIDIPFHTGEGENLGFVHLRVILGFDPEITRRLFDLEVTEVTEDTLLEFARDGVLQAREALAILDGEVAPSLVSGLL